MTKGKFGVVVQHQGKRPNSVLVEGGATIRTALLAAQAKGFIPKGDVEAYANKATLMGKKANLSDRVETNSLIALSEDVSGGSR